MMNSFRSGFGGGNSVVKNIIIINVLMVLLQFTLFRVGINLADYLGLHYWASPMFKWWQPVTYIFMHGDPDPRNMQETLLHIFSNMFALWMFGRILESTWGPKRFLTFYFVCGLGAAFCHMGVLTFEFNKFHNAFLIFQQNPTLAEYTHFIRQQNLTGLLEFDKIYEFWRRNPECVNCADQANIIINMEYAKLISVATVGASGAVFGVLFAFGYLFPNTELMLIFPPIPIKAKWFVGFYALFELYAGIQNSAGDNIAHFAHLGGMLFAFILLRIWNNNMRNRYY